MRKQTNWENNTKSKQMFKEKLNRGGRGRGKGRGCLDTYTGLIMYIFIDRGN